MRTAFGTYSGVAVAVVLSLAGVCAADTSVATGTTWEVTRNNGASYITPPGTLSNRTLPDGSLSTGIFEGNPSNTSDTWYREFFELTEATVSAKVHFRTDDLFELLVNGNAVAGIVDDVPNIKEASPVAGLTIPAAFFQLGTNEILFKTQVTDGDPYLAARLDITSVPEPASAMLIGLAGGLALLARRRLRA